MDSYICCHCGTKLNDNRAFCNDACYNEEMYDQLQAELTAEYNAYKHIAAEFAEAAADYEF